MCSSPPPCVPLSETRLPSTRQIFANFRALHAQDTTQAISRIFWRAVPASTIILDQNLEIPGLGQTILSWPECAVRREHCYTVYGCVSSPVSSKRTLFYLASRAQVLETLRYFIVFRVADR